MVLFVMFIVGCLALWRWVRAKPLGAVGVFLAEVFLFGPASHPGWSWTNPDDIALIALFVAVALAPIGVKLCAISLRAHHAKQKTLLDAPYRAPIVLPMIMKVIGWCIVVVGVTAARTYHWF